MAQATCRVLHGCTQTAAEYDHGTGWSSPADSLSFAIVYPQQQPANNPKTVSPGFCPVTSRAETASTLSIREMVAASSV
jgi:poly(3-hydroxybutyrate) depolymerase